MSCVRRCVWCSTHVHPFIFTMLLLGHRAILRWISLRLKEIKRQSWLMQAVGLQGLKFWPGPPNPVEYHFWEVSAMTTGTEYLVLSRVLHHACIWARAQHWTGDAQSSSGAREAAGGGWFVETRRACTLKTNHTTSERNWEGNLPPEATSKTYLPFG